MQKIVIAIDGFSSTGKSSTAKKVAQLLGYVYVDTGAMYRTVAYLAKQKGLIAFTGIQNQETQQFETVIHIEKHELLQELKNSRMQFIYNPELGFSEIYLNDKNIEKEIRSIEISNMVSEVAKIAEIRSYLVEIQRKMGEKKGVVMDGRDIGSVVFPAAELKIFMTASEEIRAKRRFKELREKGDVTTSFEEVLQNARHRDLLDTTRKESPLIKADDAIEIDNSFMTFEQQVCKIIDLAKNKIDTAQII